MKNKRLARSVLNASSFRREALSLGERVRAHFDPRCQPRLYMMGEGLSAFASGPAEFVAIFDGQQIDFIRRPPAINS